MSWKKRGHMYSVNTDTPYKVQGIYSISVSVGTKAGLIKRIQALDKIHSACI